MSRTGRRRVILAAVVAAVALVLAIGRPLLVSMVAARARRELLVNAEAGLQSSVTLASVDVTLYPASLVFHDLRLERDGLYGLQAGSSLERAELRGSPLALMFWGSRPVDILAERPRCRMVLRFPAPPAPGDSAAPAASLAPGGMPQAPIDQDQSASVAGAGAASLPALPPQVFPPGSTLTVRHGEFAVTSDLGIHFECADLGLDTHPASSSAIVAGRVNCAGGELHTPAGEWSRLEGQVGFERSSATLRLEPVILHGEGLDLSGRLEVTGLPSPQGPPRLEGEIVVGADAAKLGAFMPPDADPRGHLEAHLRGGWSGGLPRVDGTVTSEAIRLFGVEATGVKGDLRIDRSIHLDQLQARLLGGGATGSLEVVPGASGTYEARASVDATGLDAERLLAQAAWTGPPIRGTLRYRGTHTLDQTGIGSLRGGGELGLAGQVGAAHGAPMPIEATMHVETRGRDLELRGGSLSSRSVQAQFDGHVSPVKGLELRLQGGTGNIADLLPLFSLASGGRPRAAAPPPARPGSVVRPATFRGTVDAGAVFAVARWTRTLLQPPSMALPARATGKTATSPGRKPPAASPAATPAGSGLETLLKALGGRWEWRGSLRYDRHGLNFEGTLAGVDLTYHGTLLGALEAEVQYAGERLTVKRATLRPAEGAAAHVRGEVDFRGAGKLQLESELDDIPLGTLLAMAGVSIAAEGAVHGQAQVGGSFAAPEGHATFETERLSLQGMPFDRMEGDLSLQDDRLRVGRFNLTQGEGSIAINGALPLRHPDPGHSGDALTFKGGGLDLAACAAWLRGLPVEGRLTKIDGRLTGALFQPEGHLSLRGEAVEIARFMAGPIEAEADLSGGTVRLRATAPDRTITLAGTVGADGEFRSDLALEIGGLTLRGPELMTGIPEDVSLSLAGRATITGPLLHPRAIVARGGFDSVRLSAGDAAATSEGAVDVELRGGRLELKPARLVGEGTRIDLRAGVDLDPEGRVDFQARGSFDLALLRSFVRGLQAQGTGDIELHVTGLSRDPDFRGLLQMTASRVRYPDLPFPIDNLEGRVAFDGVGARIETLTFKAGGGDVESTGEVLLGKTGPSAGPASILAADLRFKGHGVGSDFPSGFRSLSDPDLRYVFDPTGGELSGRINLVRGVYSRDFRLASTILTGRPRALFDLPNPEGPIGAMRLDLNINAPEQIWLRNDLGRIEGQVDLRITGTAARPSVAGRVTALEGSTIDFNRIRYRVLNGTIDFDNPEAIDPLFNLSAETSVGEYQVSLQVDGRLSRFNYELSSNPPLQQGDIVTLLVTGRPGTTGGDITRGLSTESVSAYFAGTLGQEISSKFLGRAGPDLISIDPMEVVAQGDPTTRITLGKQITPDLRVTYTDLLGVNQGSSYALDYSFGRSLGFTTERDSDGSIGGDFRYILTGKAPEVPGVTASASAGAPRPGKIGAVAIEGDLGVDEKSIRRRLRARPDARWDRAKINDGLDRVLAYYHRKGYLTADLDLREAAAAGDRIDLTLHVTAGPVIETQIEGARGRTELRDAIAPLWQQAIFMEDTVESARDRIESIERDKGWRQAKVAATLLGNDAAAVRVRFQVERGTRVQTEAIQIAGARQLRDQEVRRVIDSHPDDLFHRGIVRGDRLREDAAAIEALYLSRGFPEAAVAAPEVIQDAGSDHATVVFHVEEGPRVSVRRTIFQGGDALPSERLGSEVNLPEGVPYTRDGVDASASRLRRAFDDAGFPDARVQVQAERQSADPEAQEVDLTFVIDEGRRQTIGNVRVAGNAHTNDKVIRKALTVEPYDPLSRSDLIASQTRLYRLGIFRAVDLRPTAPPAPAGPPKPPPATTTPRPATTPEPATEAAPAALPSAGDAEPEDTDPWLRQVDATVQEIAPIRQVFGLGYDSEAKLRGLYEIAHRNLFGSGRYLGLQLRSSSIEQRATLLYREQGVFGGRYDLSGSTYGLDEERPAFNGRTVGLGAELSRQVTQATRIRYRYSLKDVNLSESTIGQNEDAVRLASISVSGVHDTRDSPFSPLRGHYYAADLQGYGDVLGSEADFFKLYFQAFTFRTVAYKTVWAQAIRAGAMPTFGPTRTDPQATGDDASGVPQSERFYAGGDTTLRGIGRDLAGELDAQGSPFGGEGLFLLNEEVRFPIWRSLQGVVFTDIGNVYRTLSDYTLRDLRTCIGAGLRLMTPIGPFRLEYGALLDARPDEARGQLFISIGQAF